MQHDLSHRTSQNIATYVRYSFMLTLMTLGTMLLMSEPAVAQADSPMGYVICTIIDFVFGNLGRGLSVLAVMIVGVGATLGKVSWGLALTVATGIAAIFGSASIVGYIVYGNWNADICGTGFNF